MCFAYQILVGFHAVSFTVFVNVTTMQRYVLHNLYVSECFPLSYFSQ